VEGYLNPFKAAAASLGVGAIVAPVHDMPEVEFLVSASEPNSGVVVIPDAFTISHRAEIILLAARYRIPAVYWSRSFAELGGLISYGPDLVDEYRRAASYADRILKGAKPSELPVQAPVKFELVINLQTAKALGLDPDWVHSSADFELASIIQDMDDRRSRGSLLRNNNVVRSNIRVVDLQTLPQIVQGIRNEHWYDRDLTANFVGLRCRCRTFWAFATGAHPKMTVLRLSGQQRTDDTCFQAF
jgi:hypothetical protein